mgnify:CR=1 FL=1
MKKIFFFLSIVVICAVIYLVLINTNGVVNVDILKGTAYTKDLTKEIGLPLYTLAVLTAGIFSGAGLISLFLGVAQDKVKAYKRELEKTAISGETNASKVDVLEAKIKTLEKAFTSVVDERTKLEVQIKELNAEIDNLNKK